MERNILFRGQRIYDKTLIYGEYISEGNGTSFLRVHYSNLANDWDDIEVITETVGQLVGLVGKNKMKVFEGDTIIIHWNDGEDGIADIIYSPEEFGFNYISKGCLYPGNSLYELANYNIELVNEAT
jgi:hypothetical protein